MDDDVQADPVGLDERPGLHAVPAVVLSEPEEHRETVGTGVPLRPRTRTRPGPGPGLDQDQDQD